MATAQEFAEAAWHYQVTSIVTGQVMSTSAMLAYIDMNANAAAALGPEVKALREQVATLQATVDAIEVPGGSGSWHLVGDLTPEP